jgi:hypothetical protein
MLDSRLNRNVFAFQEDYPMINSVTQVEQLKAAIHRQEITLAQLEADIAEFENDLTPFRVRYNHIVGPMVERLEAAKAVAAELEHSILMSRLTSEPLTPAPWNMPAGDLGINLRSAADNPTTVMPAASPPSNADRFGEPDQLRLKRLYHELVQRFHPDRAIQAGEVASRNQLLAVINEAYEKRDLKTLEALTALANRDSTSFRHSKMPSTDELWQMVTLYRLEQTHAQLASEITERTQTRDALLHSELMDLQIEAKFAQRQGRDLLREIARSLEAEYRDYMARIDELRRHLAAFDVANLRPISKAADQHGETILLCLSVAGRGPEIPIRLKSGEKIDLGRGSTSVSESLLDLTSFGAQDLGVSRQHAAIVNQSQKSVDRGAWVMDLGSTNGTYLNGQRLTPHEMFPIADDDELRLGRLRIQIHYRSTVASFLEWIRLRNSSSNASWATNRQTWRETLKLARIYGWHPPLGASDASYTPGMQISREDAEALAGALECALPDLADESPHMGVQRLDTQLTEPSIRYFGGRAGKQRICDLITFCRQGAFKIEAW